jgi:hypothetical protein
MIGIQRALKVSPANPDLEAQEFKGSGASSSGTPDGCCAMISAQRFANTECGISPCSAHVAPRFVQDTAYRPSAAQ